MKYKQIVTSGCSYAKNSFEENRARKNRLPEESFTNPSTGEEFRINFTEELGRLLNIPTYNLSVNGISLKFIVYHAYLWVTSNLDKVKDTLLIVSLTHRGRETLWRRSSEREKYKLPGIQRRMTQTMSVPVPNALSGKGKDKEWVDQRAISVGTTPDKFNAFLEVFWKDLIDLDSKYIQDEMMIVLLNGYCKSIGLDVLYIDVPGEHRSGFTNWRNLVDGEFINFPKGIESWKAYLTSIDTRYYGEHPNYNDHVEFGKLLSDYIANK